MMSGRNPSGTFTRPGAAAVGTPVPKSTDRAAFCGCCCYMSQSVLVVIIAFLYLTTAVLSGISVGGGVDNHMSQYSGQVQINANYTVTQVAGNQLNLRTGWLKFGNGTAKGNHDLTELSGAAGALGYVTAFLLLVSLIVATMKVFSIAVNGGKNLRRGSICLGLLVSLIMLVFLVGLYVSSSSDLDSYAHAKLSVPSYNNIAMAPGYAWYCGFFASVMWTFINIFTHGMPDRISQEYHQF